MSARRGRSDPAGPATGATSGATPTPTVPRAQGAPTGHRLEPEAEGWRVEAWSPDLTRCLVEALAALIEAAEGEHRVEEAPSYETLPLAAGPGGASELLLALAEEVIGLQQVLSLVPVRVHLAPTEDGGVAGDLEVVRGGPPPGGRLPRSVSRDGLAAGRGDHGWWCRLRLLA